MKTKLAAILMAGCVLQLNTLAAADTTHTHAGLPNQPDFGSNNISTDTHGCGCACTHCTGNGNVFANNT